jgi:thermostable 8-oxoguanine DNA glycosylase
MNYPEPTELHDYSYLGAEKRERERIRRRVNSWCQTLARLPILERKAIVDAITEINLDAPSRPLAPEATSEPAAVRADSHAKGVVDPRRGGALPSSQTPDQSTKEACPCPDEFVMSNLLWGRSDVLFTPAYWATQLRLHAELGQHGGHRLGESLKEEAAACLLGGHGIPANVGLAAFFAVRESGLLDQSSVSAEDIYDVLSQPLDVGGQRHVRYRFARQKSSYLAGLLNGFTTPPCESDARALRDWLTGFDGVGPKTASWIVRNWLDSDEVAIIDIHIHRAGILTGFFGHDQVIARDYAEMELQFLAFSTAIAVRSSALDALIWSQMRQANTLAIRLLRQYHERTLDATELCATGD